MTNFWRKEEDRKRRWCGKEGETIEHVLEYCGKRKNEWNKERLLDDSGNGIRKMREIKKMRERSDSENGEF